MAYLTKEDTASFIQVPKGATSLQQATIAQYILHSSAINAALSPVLHRPSPHSICADLLLPPHQSISSKCRSTPTPTPAAAAVTSKAANAPVFSTSCSPSTAQPPSPAPKPTTYPSTWKTPTHDRVLPNLTSRLLRTCTLPTLTALAAATIASIALATIAPIISIVARSRCMIATGRRRGLGSMSIGRGMERSGMGIRMGIVGDQAVWSGFLVGV